MSFADQSRGLLAANPAGTMGQITTPSYDPLTHFDPSTGYLQAARVRHG